MYAIEAMTMVESKFVAVTSDSNKGWTVMAILGIGVDLVNIPRITALLSRRDSQRFASRILSPDELALWQSIPLNRRVQFLAVRYVPSNFTRFSTHFIIYRWGVKEAAYKAMFPVVRPTWKDLTYHGAKVADDGQWLKPSLTYRPPASSIPVIGRIHVSVSHDGDYVYASVLVEGYS
jgi:holo-[acyl-carrier protein] synthase